MSSNQIRVLCVDDHPLVLEGIIRKIDLQADMKVIAAVTTGEEAGGVLDNPPGCCVIDLRLPGISGVETIRRLRTVDQDIRVVVLTMHEGEEDVYRAIDAGAKTFIPKRLAADTLVSAIRNVIEGKESLLPDIGARLEQRRSQRALSAREVRILELIAEGYRNKEIAAQLDISPDTVEVHVRNLFSKLGVHERTTAVRVAAQRGIIHLD